jgi:hypothetical protein
MWFLSIGAFLTPQRPYGGDGSVAVMTVRVMVLVVMLNHLVPSFTSPLIRNDRACNEATDNGTSNRGISAFTPPILVPEFSTHLTPEVPPSPPAGNDEDVIRDQVMGADAIGG